jgi:hypothetical protein
VTDWREAGPNRRAKRVTSFLLTTLIASGFALAYFSANP